MKFAFAVGYHPALLSCRASAFAALPQSNLPRLVSPKGRWVQNGLRMEGMREPPTGSANLVIGKSPVERGIARAYLYSLARGVLSLQLPPVGGHRLTSLPMP